MWAATILPPLPDTVYQMQSIVPDTDIGTGTAIMFDPTATTFTAIIKQYGFSSPVFGKINNKRFPLALSSPIDAAATEEIAVTRIQFQLPALGVFVPTALPASAASTPSAASFSFLPLNTPINFSDRTAGRPPHMTVLMAKKRLREYNPNPTRASANPLGDQLLNVIFGTDRAFPVDVRSHTERPLVKALLNRPDVDAKTSGDVYVYTLHNPCVDSNPDVDNQGIPCFRWYEALRLLFPQIKLHLFFRNFDSKILDHINLRLLSRLIDFIEEYTGPATDFQAFFPDFKVNGRMHKGVLMVNCDVQEIHSVLGNPQIRTDQFAGLARHLQNLGINHILLHEGNVPVTGITQEHIGQKSANRDANRNTIKDAATAATLGWQPATPSQIPTLLKRINVILGNQSPSLNVFVQHLKNGIMQALYGDSTNITYHFVQ